MNMLAVIRPTTEVAMLPKARERGVATNCILRLASWLGCGECSIEASRVRESSDVLSQQTADVSEYTEELFFRSDGMR